MSDKKEVKQPEQQEEKAAEEKSDSKEKTKFKFECTKCGACCQNRKAIPVSFTDLARWTKQGSFIQIILPHLELESLSDADEISKIALIPFIKMKDVDENGLGMCPFFDPENNICNIYFTMPIFCKTFPLSFNGEKFYVSDATCEGIGKGSMTKEGLLEMRETAMKEYSQRAETSLSMVPLQGMFIRHFMKQSQETVNKLSEEDQKKLDELINKSKDESTEEQKPADK